MHNSLSSVLVALTTERDRLRELHQGSELSRIAVRLGDIIADQKAGPRLRTAGPVGKICARAQGLTEAVPELVWVVGGEDFPFPYPVPRPLPQVSEAPEGQRRLHSLSISSDTTADSFSSLNPEEVRI